MQENSENNPLYGKRYIALARCSTKQQKEHSVPDQLKVISQFANERGMTHVGSIKLEGVSGSLPGSREDLEALLHRKRTKNDFDAVIVQDASRMTRGGISHGGKIQFEFESEGIDIIYAMGQLPEGPVGDVVRSLQYYTAAEQGRDIAKNVARGSMSAMEQGRISYTRRVPYGIDRLYRGYDGTPRYIIRNLADGSQLRIDPTTGAVIEKFGINPVTKEPTHYRKLPDETVDLIPGNPDALEVVRQIFRLFFKDRLGFGKIASYLNKNKIPSSTGRNWHKKSVKIILRNQIYTGIGVINRSTNGVHYTRFPGAPRHSGVKLKDLKGRKRPKNKLRPPEDWINDPEAALADFLPEDIRQAAEKYQQKYWADKAAGRNDESLHQKSHGDSRYFLRDILVSKQGGYAMRGRASGAGKWRTRYYIVKYAESHPGSLDPMFDRCIPAAPIEQLVLRMLQNVLLRAPYMKDNLRKRIMARFGAKAVSEDRVTPLTTQLLKLKTQKDFVIENVDVVGKDESRQRLADLNDQIESVSRSLGAARTTVAWDKNRVEQATDALIKILNESSNSLRSLPLAAIQGILEVILAKATVDMVDRTVVLEFRLPTWAVENPVELRKSLGLGDTSCVSCTPYAHDADGVLLGKYVVYWLGKHSGYLGYGIAA